MAEFVRVEVDQQTQVATIRLDRPKVNALNRQIEAELKEAAARVTADDGIGAAVIWGGERVFAAGADIHEMRGRTFAEIAQAGGVLQAALTAIARIPKVVIAAVNGYALGGGCELALAADLRFAATDAQFGQPEILLGIIPGAGGTQRLPRLIGPARAKQMIYGGRPVGAEQALAWGLADAVFPPGEVYPEALAAAARYARGPRLALRAAKQAVDAGLEMDLDSALLLETHAFQGLFATEDAKTGLTSFIEEGPGKARFSGR